MVREMNMRIWVEKAEAEMTELGSNGDGREHLWKRGEEEWASYCATAIQVSKTSIFRTLREP
jgi:hypothetical protein